MSRSPSQPGSGRGHLEAKVLILDEDLRTAKRIAKVVRSAVQHVECAPALTSVEAVNSDLLIVNLDTLDPSTREMLCSDSALDHTCRRLFYSKNCAGDHLSALFTLGGLSNLLARDPDIDPVDLLVTVRKILSDDIFGVDKYFAWGACAQTRDLRSSDQRRDALSWVKEFASAVSLRDRRQTPFVSVADELLTNAFYNAPADGAGNRIYAHLPRTRTVELQPPDVITVDLRSDGNRIGICVSDPFGSLGVTTVLDYLAKCFRKGSDQVDTKDGGAGLGFYYIFELLSHLVINITPGQRTEAIGLMPLHGSHRDFVESGKSFNVFVSEADTP